jgi:GTPase SAR1 family protein
MEKKKYDIILIGPQMAGKTALLNSLQGRKTLEYIATQSNGEATKVSMGDWWKRNFGADKKILDTGGKFNEFEKYTEWCKESQIIVFVFNGCELLEEVKDFGLPGKNTSFCRRICVDLEKDANVCFVATHKDLFQGTDMGSSILQAIEKSNNDYGLLFPNMTKRYYPFSELMIGRLFSANALNENEVKDLFKKIVEL